MEILDFVKLRGFEIISLLIGLFTLWIAIKVHKEFIKNHATSKQVEEMCSLVKSLNQSKIGLTFWIKSKGGGAGHGYGIYYNIFEIGGLYKTDKVDSITKVNLGFPEFDDELVVLEDGSEQVLDVKEFIDNPFIPKNIADYLMNFYCSSFRPVELGHESLKFVAADTSISEAQGHVEEKDGIKKVHINVGTAFAMKSWENFKIHSFYLTKHIEKWFREHGVKDFNIRIDYKNIKP